MYGDKDLAYHGSYTFQDDNTTIKKEYPGKYLLDQEHDFLHDTTITTFVYDPNTETNTETTNINNGHPINNSKSVYTMKKKEITGDSTVIYSSFCTTTSKDTTTCVDQKSISIVLSKNEHEHATKKFITVWEGDSIVYKSLNTTNYLYYK